ISNLAAISGSSSEQASTAMYQLSQAIATGTLKLQDWNSVTNAGMGGEVFQKALFESGKALGTIEGVPIDQTFQEWTDAGNSFRGSLQEGWLTSEVLTTTLQGFTGEMTEAQLTAIGYTKEQAAEILELGKTGVEAATKVRTLTGLITTTKEAIGSGWSQSFRIVFGNFEEATELFSNISGIVGNIVKKNAEARNKVLQGWKDLGGRENLFNSIIMALAHLNEIIKPIKEAFREVFPPITAERLFALTERFTAFAKALKPSEKTIDSIKRTFKGLFSILKIGWEVIQEGSQFVKALFTSFTDAGSGRFLEFAAKIGDFITDLSKKLVEGAGIQNFFVRLRKTINELIPYFQLAKDAIVAFFDDVKQVFSDLAPYIDTAKDKISELFEGLNIRDIVGDPIGFLVQLKDNFLNLFKGVDLGMPEEIGNVFGRLEQRFETLQKVFDKVKDIWKPFKDGFVKVIEVLDTAWDAIRNWFAELIDKMAKVMKPGDFDAVVDAVNVGLVGGILVVLRNFFKKGIKFDIGEGILSNISKSFEQLTGIMKAMQTDIKANALLKIAGAIAILTASVLVLSLIDSAALTKALTAMAIGFGQLMASFAILSKMSSGPKGAASFDMLAAGIIILSGAILVLSLAMKVLATMSWEEIGKGLTAISTLLGILTVAVKLMPQKSLISVGVGMMAIAIAMNILAGAVKLFSMMSMEELGRGFVGVAGGLVSIALAMRLMPKNMALQGVGLLLVATSLSILAGAVKLFSMMSWEDIGKGMVGIAGALLIIGLAMNLMPPTMPIIGAGLVLVSIGLLAISQALMQMGGMSWGEIAKGLVAMAGGLLILAVAAHAMQGALLGFVAMTIGAVALTLLSKVLVELSGISWSDLLRGLVGIAAILGVLAVAALLMQPALPALIGLGVALLAIGAGFALFGFGANLVAKAFETLSKVGKAGAETFLASLEAIGKALPILIKGFAEGLVELIQVFIDAAPVIAKGLVVLLDHILDGLGKLLPKAFKLIGKLISGILDLIQDKYPEFVETGLGLLVALLEGISNNLPKVVHLVGDIITGFLDALTAEIPRVVKSLQAFLTTVFEQVIIGLNPATLLFLVGSDILEGFWNGIWDKLTWLKDKVLGFFGQIIDWIKSAFGINSPATKMLSVGKDIVLGLFNGIKESMSKITNWAKNLALNVLKWIGNVSKTLINKGKDFIKGMWDGIWDRMQAVITWYKNLAKSVLNWIGNVARTLYTKGRNFISGLWDGIWDRVQAVITWFRDLASKVLGWIGNVARTLYSKGRSFISGLWDGIKDKFADVVSWFGDIPSKITSGIGDVGSALYGTGKDLIQGFWNGIKDIWDDVWAWIQAKIDLVPDFLKGLLGLNSPSKITMEMGQLFMEGFAVGFARDKTFDQAQEDLVTNVSNFRDSLNAAYENIGTMDEFNPVITPVLDLSMVQADAGKINDYIQATQPLVPAFSYKQAQTIAASTRVQAEESNDSSLSTRGDVRFEQNIYAPKQLSTNDIYKQTRNQITMAKEELSIP
ncbi:MAG: tape measure protein, partial [Paenisporosarcina sp.]